MTVAELRAALEALPANADADAWTIVLSCDAEGNRFSPLSEVGRGNYEAETTWTGGFIDELELEHPDLAALPLNALCLWPVR